MSAKKVFQRLLRSRKPQRNTDLLSDREYHDLASTPFEEYQRNNFNSTQLQQLSDAEVAQLDFHYQLLEKKSERTQKRLRDKRQRAVVPPVVVRYVPAPSEAEQVVPLVANDPDTQNVREDDTDFRQVLDDIEKRIDEPRPQPEEQIIRSLSDDTQRSVEELNVTLNMIDLSKTMPPKELLLEEPLAQPVLEEFGELDLGPPGDAAAFLGVDSPMLLSDEDVRNRLLQEFPSLRRPNVGGRFEDMDEVPLEMPPPPGTGILSSTPISGIPTAAIRRIPKRVAALYDTNLSAIKGPTPPDVAAPESTIAPTDPTNVTAEETPLNVTLQNEQSPIGLVEQSSEPLLHTIPEPVPEIESAPVVNSATVLELSPVTELGPVVESATVTEPAQPEQQDVIRVVPVSASTESSSSAERPAERPRVTKKSVRKLATNGDSILKRCNLRMRFIIGCSCDDLEAYEPMRALIQWISSFSEDRGVTIPRPIPADIEEQLRRDISGTQAELSSIHERNQSRLFPIQERPEQEQLAEQQLQHVSLPRPIVEPVEHPFALPEVQLPPNLPEVSLNEANLLLNTGLENQTMFPDASASTSIPLVVITDTSTEDSSRLNREVPPVSKKPVIAPPNNEEARTQPEGNEPLRPSNSRTRTQQIVLSGQDQLEGNGLVAQVAEAVVTGNEKALASITNVYFAIQRETARSRRNSVEMNYLAQITSTDRAASAKRFMYLLEFKKHKWIEIRTDDGNCVQTISLLT